MRGHVRFQCPNPEESASQFAEAVGGLLRKARPKMLEVEGRTVVVSGGMFRWGVSSRNLLGPVTKATIEAVPDNSGFVVHYDIRFTELVIFCCVGTVWFVFFTASTGDMRFVAASFAMVWGFMFGSPYISTRTRMLRLFRAAAEKVVGTGKLSGAP